MDAGFQAQSGHFAVKAVDTELTKIAASDVACLLQSLL